MGTLVLLHIHVTGAAHINHRDVPVANVNKNKVRPILRNCPSGKLTGVINTVLTLTLLNYFFFLHFYYKLGLCDKDGAHQSTFLLICQN